MRCKTCMWFVPKVPGMRLCPNPMDFGRTQIEVPKPYDLGRCRRHAPTMSGWPVVFVNDWCGDHKIDEEKI